ncbi:ribosomal protein S6 kinase delta-1 isoform X2 [Sardina pilchardus]|uniref:ribosomal protein S6 kinase delta-1 isoform X2 n=1 Tax=Sardina pilchardus TaxID=27697 RepID=UPI002E10C29B
MAKRDYLVDAARQIRMALDREVSEDYEAAFNYYKKGVDLLLNGIQVDPNKEQREAVKRKTTQYLKRAEDIFISHLQNNYQKGGSQMEGYSSLRFRPIRHLNSPVEDLKMYKVVGIIDKVLTVQSLVCKDSFVIKSLPKSSGNCRDRPTIIPQNVPCMVKLLRYYVSEDAVYLHLDHVTGGKLFSKLHKLRGQPAKEHPECCSQHKIGLKNSYTSPAISAEYGQDEGPTVVRSPPTEGGPAITTSPASWYEAQQRLETCRTHSYSEETGCLQHSKLEKLDAKLNRELSLNAAKAPLELSTSSSQKNHSLTTHLSPHSDLQQSPSVNSEQPIHDTRPDRTMHSSELANACHSSDPLHKCGACMTALHTGSNYAVDNVQTSLEHPLSTDPRRTTNDEVGTTAAEPASFSRELNSETKGEAIDPRCNKTSSGNVCSQIVLSSDEFSMQHMVDPAGGGSVSGEVSDERLQKPEEEGKGDLGSLDQERLQKAAHERGLGSPSSGLARDTHSPDEMEDLDIEVDGWYHVPQFKKQVSRGKSSHGHWGLPEAEVCTWGAQILVALESLHDQGIICSDLNPNNILLSSHGEVCLTYFGQWSEVQPVICPRAMEQMYCAPGNATLCVYISAQRQHKTLHETFLSTTHLMTPGSPQWKHGPSPVLHRHCGTHSSHTFTLSTLTDFYYYNTWVFNRGSATPRGSAEVLQGVRENISSEAFFSLPKNNICQS